MGSKSTTLVALQQSSCPEPVNALSHDGLWINSTELARLASIDESNASKALIRALNNHTWRGATINVRTVEGIGGRGGKALQVFIPSLPADLREKWHQRYQIGAATPAPIADPVTLPAPSTYAKKAGKLFAEARWKIDILAPALVHAPRSHARGEALRLIAAQEHIRFDGKRVKVAYSTLGEWLRKLETKGEAALPRKQRPQGIPRVIVNREWDAACPLPDDKKEQIADELKTHIKSQWGGGVPGVNRISDFATSRLVELCRAAGWSAANLENCNVGRYFAEQFRAWSDVARKERNAKDFFDTRTPRVKVNRENLKPGDVVVGDVHPFDVAKEEDGRTVHARLISWLDLATYDIFVTVVILEPGRGIRQEDIAGSFVDMVEAWGLPKQLRLDNGKEYKWEAMMEGFNTLAGLVRSFGLLFLPGILGEGDKDGLVEGLSFDPRNAISRARPYNAPAKQIEGVFGILEYYFFAMMPGWIGGDRMNKRTHKVGEAPKAHDGTDQDFLRDITICLDLYRNTKQRDGSSPYDKRRTAYDAGHVPVRAAREVFLFAFSEVRRLTVHTSGIHVDGKWGICDAIIPYIGQKLEIRVAKWDRSHAFYQDPEGRLHAIPLGITYDHDDPAGAKEQARRAKVLNTHIRGLKAETTPLDLMAEAERHLSHMPPPPQLPEGIRINTAEGTAITTALAEAKAPPPKKRLSPGAFINTATGEEIRPTFLPPTLEPEIPALPLPQMERLETAPTVPSLDEALLMTFRDQLNTETK